MTTIYESVLEEMARQKRLGFRPWYIVMDATTWNEARREALPWQMQPRKEHFLYEHYLSYPVLVYSDNSPVVSGFRVQCELMP